MPEKPLAAESRRLVISDSAPLGTVELDSLIGRAVETDILKSAVPYLDENDNVLNFPDLSRSGMELGGIYTSGAAFLFAGESGNGKKTLDSAFLSYILEYIGNIVDEANADGVEMTKDDCLKCYVLRDGDLKGDSREDSLARIDGFFDDIAALCDDAENNGIIYISLGDITSVVKKKKPARLLARRVGEILASLNSQCLITARIEADEADIPDCLHEAFTTLYLPSPDRVDRLLYFDGIAERYPAILLAKSADELTDKTEGFTFRMLKRLTDMALMTAKGRITASSGKLEPYMGISSDDVPAITIEEECLDALIATVRESTKKRQAKASGIPYIMPVPPTTVISTEGTNGNDNGDGENTNEGGGITMPNTLEEIRKSKHTLKIPSSYTPSDYKKSAEDRKTADELIADNY